MKPTTDPRTRRASALRALTSAQLGAVAGGTPHVGGTTTDLGTTTLTLLADDPTRPSDGAIMFWSSP